MMADKDYNILTESTPMYERDKIIKILSVQQNLLNEKEQTLSSLRFWNAVIILFCMALIGITFWALL